jgi:hypothetical protein
MSETAAMFDAVFNYLNIKAIQLINIPAVRLLRQKPFYALPIHLTGTVCLMLSKNVIAPLIQQKFAFVDLGVPSIDTA